jgi:uncharacterized iron-regulated protein
LSICCFAFSADKPAYLIYDSELKNVQEYSLMVKQLAEADIVFFGETHNNPICHWLELQVTKDLFAAQKEKLVLGAEMFEADNQLVINEYLEGKITASQLEAESKIWKNYQTDYKPLMDFAKKNKLSFVATNIPRRYASMVSKNGVEALQSLSDLAKKTIAPLPFEVDLTLPGYKSMMDMGGMHGGGATKVDPNVVANMAKAQASKDATMAHFILQNWQKGKVFLHYNGTYHSQNFEGIVWYLKKANPALKIVTIATSEEEDVTKPQEAKPKLANFILAIPADMTKTY